MDEPSFRVIGLFQRVWGPQADPVTAQYDKICHLLVAQFVGAVAKCRLSRSTTNNAHQWLSRIPQQSTCFASRNSAAYLR